MARKIHMSPAIHLWVDDFIYLFDVLVHQCKFNFNLGLTYSLYFSSSKNFLFKKNSKKKMSD